MELTDITYHGPEIGNAQFLESLPKPLRELLTALNGFILFNGGLHVRGVCDEPNWHSLQRVCEGPHALSKSYDALQSEDIPFGQDCVGDQFILRDGSLLRLLAETGELEPLSIGLGTFFEAVYADPVSFLGLEPLLQLRDEGESLQPGQLIHAYPPFCTEQSADGVSLRAVPCDDLLETHADFASQLPADGSLIIVRVED